MSFEEHLTEFAGLPVVSFPDVPDAPLPILPVDQAAWRIGIDHDFDWDSGPNAQEYGELFPRFLDRVDTTRVTAFVIGATTLHGHQDTSGAVAALVEHVARFPSLRALFVGDIVREEADVAYIQAPHLNPLLEAFPDLEVLTTRGSFQDQVDPRRGSWDYLIKPLAHRGLRSLTLETGGLAPRMLRNVLACELPNLEHLELYFGDPAYGGDGTVEDLHPLLSGDLFPKLRSLGLRDSFLQDEIAAALADSPLVARLEVLDLSLGALGDEGVTALLDGQPLTHLKKLDLHHHYLSEDVLVRVRAELPGVEVDLSEHEIAEEPDEWNPSGRYIAVGE